MERCPAEVLHQICAFLEPTDAATLRLSCKAVAAIAEHYVVKGQVRFNLSLDSLKRLVLISEHPVFSQYVTKLCYEANILLPVTSTREFSEYFTRGTSDSPPEEPPRNCTSREMRLYERNLHKWQQGDKGLSPKKLQAQYEAYRKTYNSQQEIIRNKSDVKILGVALARFGKLAEISVFNYGRCKHAVSGRFWEQFSDGLRPPMSLDTEITVRQLDSILRAIDKTSLRVLDAKVVSPRIFSDPAIKASLSGCLANLHKLSIALRLEEDESEALDWDEPGHLYRPIRKGQLHEALSHATQLQDLSIHFNDCCHHPHSFAKLKHILGDHSWPQLKKLDLSRFDCTADGLLESLKRQPKLTHLGLTCITMTRGSWAEAFCRLRKELNLQKTDFEGWLRNTHVPDEFMIMDYVDADAYSDEPDWIMTLSEVIDMYLTDGMDDDDDSFNPAKRLEEFVDLDELKAEMDSTESELEMMIGGMF